MIYAGGSNPVYSYLQTIDFPFNSGISTRRNIYQIRTPAGLNSTAYGYLLGGARSNSVAISHIQKFEKTSIVDSIFLFPEERTFITLGNTISTFTIQVPLPFNAHTQKKPEVPSRLIKIR